MIDVDRLPIGEQDPLRSVRPGHHVDGGAGVVHDLGIGRCVLDQLPVEPLQVLAHGLPRHEVVLGDLGAPTAHPASVPVPAVAAADEPLVEAHPVAVSGGVVFPGIKGDLAAGCVHDQVVGLIDRVDPRTRG